jgi:hypothetical protein
MISPVKVSVITGGANQAYTVPTGRYAKIQILSMSGIFFGSISQTHTIGDAPVAVIAYPVATLFGSVDNKKALLDKEIWLDENDIFKNEGNYTFKIVVKEFLKP